VERYGAPVDRAAVSRIAHGELTLYNPLSDADLDELRKIATEQTAELWLSARTPRGWTPSKPDDYPEPIARFEPKLDVVVQLRTTNGTVHTVLLKDHDNPEPRKISVDLDPTTLLLVKR